jgi:hypothetical protein
MRARTGRVPAGRGRAGRPGTRAAAASRAGKGILRPTSLAVSFANAPEAPTHATPSAAPTLTWPYFSSPPPYVAPQLPSPPAAPWHSSHGGALGATSWPAGAPHWSASGPAAAVSQAGPGILSSPPYIKPEPGGPAGNRRDKPSAGKEKKNQNKNKPFASQPLHAYVTGNDTARVPWGQVLEPQCGCANHHHHNPGPHAVWDCPHRYLVLFGECPGYLANGLRDPSKWTPDGANLTRAGKDEWISMIEKHRLPLPYAYAGPPPDFRS